MFKCNCCQPQKTYAARKSLYRHQQIYDTSFVKPSPSPVKDAYLLNPKLCECCKGAISYKTFRSSRDAAKYCSSSCAAKINNSVSPKRKRTKVRQYLTCLSCDKTLRLKQVKYCSSACMQDYRWKLFKNDPDAIWTAQTRKRQLLEELGSRCQCCLNVEWLGKPITLEIEHIDGDYNNHVRDNTTLLCPNCHSRPPTYKAKNRGSGRAWRMQRYREGKSY